MKGSGVLGGCILLLALMILAAGCVAPPKEAQGKTPVGSDAQAQATQTATPTPEILDTRFLTPATPFPTTVPETPRPAYNQSPENPEVQTVYQRIYYNILEFHYDVVAREYPLVTPPLIIEMCFAPKTVTRNIWYESRYTSHEDIYTTQTSVSPSSFFEVRVRDKASGDILYRDGFGKLYSTDSKKTLVIRSAGDYLIEFTGNDINATVQMKIPAAPGENVTPAGLLTCPS